MTSYGGELAFWATDGTDLGRFTAVIVERTDGAYVGAVLGKGRLPSELLVEARIPSEEPSPFHEPMRMRTIGSGVGADGWVTLLESA